MEKDWENKASNGKSFVCGSFGHIVRKCKSKKKRKNAT